MKREAIIDSSTNVIKIGLAIGALFCPLMALADPTIDLVLSLLKRTGIFNQTIDVQLKHQFKNCITDTWDKVKITLSTDTQKKLLHFSSSQIEYRLKQNGKEMLSVNELESLFFDCFNTQQANDELYLQQNDVLQLCNLFLNVFKIELLSHNELAHQYSIESIDILNTCVQDLTDRVDKVEKTVDQLKEHFNKLEQGHKKIILFMMFTLVL